MVDPSTVTKLLVIVLTPTAVAGTAVWLPRLVRWLGSALRRRRDESLRPAGPPLERTAADLRRLLAEHEAVRRSPRVAMRGSHLSALEGALTDCALEAARAVGLPAPARVGRAPLPRDQLRDLLGSLADAGLVLPSPERFGQ